MSGRLPYAGVPALREGESSVSLAQGVARMAVLGTALLAMLVGNGTVQAPYSLIGRFIRAVGDAHVQGVDTQLVNSLELIATKKKKMAGG